ncbi:MAG: hypothetical protein J1F64_09940, partial [Oscillospiraceae bacterium]|nr:hypothetical protein [Oscillospiraceae bacterium]
SKYWLYINGKCAVFEGGLKRGPSKHESYYDEEDISEFLTNGENTIAALVLYFGKNGFSHLSSGMGGFLFEAQINGGTICSDDTWKAMKHPAYVEADENDDKANFRLSESNIYFDAAKDLGKWYSPDYDISGWDNADIIRISGGIPLGGLKKRIIPQLKDYGLKDYLNSKDYEGFTTTEETTVKMRLPYNAQITPYFKITAPKGKRITVKSDTYDDLLYDTKSVMSVYYTKDGEAEYECLGWLNGEYMHYTFPAGVTIHKLQYRETGYDTEFAGSFECDDEFLNKLWQKSLRTLYITMRDNFMDCPDRERTQWWGDVNVEMQMMMYCLDEKALLLYKKGVDTMAGWEEDNGYMLTVVPSVTAGFELPFQNLAGIWGFWYYYEYTGDRSVPERAYETSKRYLLSYDMNPDGTVVHRKGSWDWPDWGDNSDIAPMENAWYYMALKSCRHMAELLGYDEDTVIYKERMTGIEASYNKIFRKNGYYYDNTANGKPDDRANALAVLSGLADKDKYEEIAEILKTVENSSPYMEKYVLDALCEMGFIEEAAKRIRRRYKEMVDFDYSTLWEYWNKDGTLNHAWSGGPLITMSKYIAGIRPTDIGCKTFEIKPRMCGLNHIKCVVPSIKGLISLDITKTDESVKMLVTIPKNTTAKVYLPLIAGRLPENSRYEFTPAGEYAEFILGAGTYEL